MAYVGTPIDTQNQFQSLQGKRFSGDGSTTAFTLDIAPSSVFDIEVFVENVRQDPNSAYSISGTTLTFTGAPPSGTNNIYVVHQAKAVGTINLPEGALVDLNGGSDKLVLDADGDTTISADTDDQIDIKIGGADDFKFSANAMNVLSGSTLTIDSGATITNSGTANGFGLTLADQFRLTSDFTGDANPITSNLERVDTTGQGTIGTMTNSSGTFSFPATGIYYVSFTLSIYVNSSNSRMDFRIKSTTDNSSYNDAATGQVHGHADGDLAYMTSSIDTLIDVTNTSNDKVQFRVNNLHDANTVLSNTNSNVTYMTFIRLGDT